MNQVKDTKSDLSITINTATEIYTLKKPFLIKYCENKKLKSTGTITSELRARLSRYLKGTITLDDIDNTLSKEECDLTLITAKANRSDFNKLEKEAGISDSSDSSPDTNKINKVTSDSFFEISQDYLRLYDNINASTSSFVNNTEKILENSDITYQNYQKDSSETYENILKNLKINDTSNNIYEELKFNNQPENSEIIENKLINLNNSTTIDSNNTGEKQKFENENIAIIINNQKGDNLISEIHSTSINKQTQIMTEKMLIIKPDYFSGQGDVKHFFKQYEKAGLINSWDDCDKVKFLPIFLKCTAETFLENLENIKTQWTWVELKNELLNEFQPIGYSILLKTKLENRKQEDTESIMSFVTDIENLCRQVERNMKEEDICTYILEGLKEPILNAISLHDNSTLKKLKENLKKYELMQFRINSRSPGLNGYTEILNKQVMQLNTETKDSNQEIKRLNTKLEGIDNYYKNKIDQLCTEMYNLKKHDKTANFEDRSRNRDRSPYPEKSDYKGRNNYREKSPYPDRYNDYKFRNNSREMSNNRDRSYSRDRKDSYDRSRDTSRNRFNNRNRGNDENRKQHSRDSSRERYSRSTMPEKFNGKRKHNMLQMQCKRTLC